MHERTYSLNMGSSATSDAAARCRDAIRRATVFLAANVIETGGWSDFQTNRSGESTSWVTAHVLWHVGRLLPGIVVERGLIALLGQRSASRGWGYSEKTPPDCDSTLHALHAFHELGVARTPPDLARVLEFVLAHQMADGGFSTYGTHGELAAYRGPGSDPNYQGWTQSHVCVTAVALETLPLFPQIVPESILRKAITFVLDRQSAEGCWESYWWRSKVFATSRILRQLIRLGLAEGQLAVERGLGWLTRSAHKGGFYTNGYDLDVPCPLSTALAVRTLVGVERQFDLCLRCANWLVAQSAADGSWQGNAVLQIPPPNVTAPGASFPWKKGGKGVGSCSADRRRVYTTALIARALSDVLAKMEAEHVRC